MGSGPWAGRSTRDANHQSANRAILPTLQDVHVCQPQDLALARPRAGTVGDESGYDDCLSSKELCRAGVSRATARSRAIPAAKRESARQANYGECRSRTSDTHRQQRQRNDRQDQQWKRGGNSQADGCSHGVGDGQRKKRSRSDESAWGAPRKRRRQLSSGASSGSGGALRPSASRYRSSMRRVLRSDFRLARNRVNMPARKAPNTMPVTDTERIRNRPRCRPTRCPAFNQANPMASSTNSIPPRTRPAGPFTEVARRET